MGRKWLKKRQKSMLKMMSQNGYKNWLKINVKIYYKLLTQRFRKFDHYPIYLSTVFNFSRLNFNDRSFIKILIKWL
jgi:hypothetical protein